MSFGTHSNLQSNSPPPRRGRRVTRSREPTLGLNAASPEVPGILTGLLGSSPPQSRPERSRSSDRGDFWHNDPQSAHDHLPPVCHAETGDIPIGFDITHLLSRSNLLPTYSEDSGNIPVAWVLFNPLVAGAPGLRRNDAEAEFGPNPDMSTEGIGNELREQAGTSQEWQHEDRADQFHREHRQRYQEAVAECRLENLERAFSTDLNAPSDIEPSHHASNAELPAQAGRDAQIDTAGDPQCQSNELSDASRQHLINWLRSRAQERRAAHHDLAIDLALESSDPSSTNIQPFASTTPARDEAELTHSLTPAAQAVPAQPSAPTSTTPLGPLMPPPDPQPHFLTTLNSYRYHLGSILLQPLGAEESDEDEIRAMLNDPDIRGWLRVLAYGRRANY
ncbi:hypothetical protein AC579_6208 [Pseudocercospora musae]|uniref:Uncharacterized protein n=1 Tax=Pseudocercospora musae TaxID=113226 RepID=A0A139ICJ5_9PEZI|nr:hypothetical protein AC579_6208 [Pseudocercospora musae]